MGALCALVHLYLRLCRLVIKKLVQIDVLVHLCALVHLCTLVHLHLHFCRFVQQKNLCRLVAVSVETNSFEDSLGALRPFLGAFSTLLLAFQKVKTSLAAQLRFWRVNFQKLLERW